MQFIQRNLYVTTNLIIIVLLIFMLTGCGNNVTGKTGSIAQSGSGNTQSTNSFDTQFAFNSSGLHIQSHGFKCPGAETLSFTTDRLTYDNSEIQQIKSYVDAYYQSGINENIKSMTSLPLPPQLSLNHVTSNGMNCDLDLQITNTGKTSVEIPQVGIRITARTPYKNNHHYHMIDACTMTVCSGGKSGGTECAGYYEDLFIDSIIRINSAYFSNLNAANLNEQLKKACGDPMLASGQSNEAEISISIGKAATNNSITFAPELIVNRAGGQSHLLLSQLSRTQIFTSSDVYICYGLTNDNSLAPEKPGALNKPSDVVYLGGYNDEPQCI